MSPFTQFNEDHILTFKNSWRSFLFLGIALFILGLLALSASVFTTLLSIVFLGFILFLGGILILINTFTYWWKKWGGFLLHLFFSILYLGVGLWLIAKPIEGSISLTLLLGIFYIIAGIFRLIFFVSYKGPNWGWGAFNGVIALIIGILILTSWPMSGLFIIGLFIGIDLLLAGITYISAALTARELAKQP